MDAKDSSILSLKDRIARLQKQCDADSEAMNKMAATITAKDKEMVERCKTCARARALR